MRRLLGTRYSDFSRDETEWGCFEDPKAAPFGFGASPVVARPSPVFAMSSVPTTSAAASQSVLRSSTPFIAAPSSVVAQRPSSVPASAINFDQNTVRGVSTPAPASSSSQPGSLAGVMAAAMQGAAPKQIYVNPAAGSKNAFANMLAAVAANVLPNAAPLPASVTKQVGFTPFPLSATPSVARITVNPAAGTKNLLPDILASVAKQVLPNTAPLPSTVTKQVGFAPLVASATPSVQRAAPKPAASPAAPAAAVPAGPLPVSPIAVAADRKKYGKVYTGAQQGGYVQTPVLPAGLVHRATPNPVAPKIDQTTLQGFVTWAVTNQGTIYEGPNPHDLSTPQWWVYATGRVVRLG